MIDLSIREILVITDGQMIGDIDAETRNRLLNTKVNKLVTDSRKIEKGNLFVAIPGNNVDGHAFIPQVAEITNAALVENDLDEIRTISKVDTLPLDFAYIKVKDTTIALQQIGEFIRGRYTGIVVGVTGSVGKTTTREMIATAISSSIPVYHTKGNENSQIGVPITLSDILDAPSDVAVIEMGISEPGEMEKLTKMVRPDIAVITIIGDSHIEYLGSREGIRDEKLKIISKMNDKGVLFVNADNPLLFEIKDQTGVKTFTYGIGSEADYRAEDIEFEDDKSSYTYVHGNDKINVKLNILGEHNVLDSLVALAICDFLNLDLTKAAKSFENFKGIRQKIIKDGKGYTIIDDSYNASPDSMKAAINVLRDMNVTGNRIAVLGDMYELGDESTALHKSVGEYINELRLDDGRTAIDTLITIGKSSKSINEAVNNTEIKKEHFKDREEAELFLKSVVSAGDAMLFKASNGMNFNKLVDKFNSDK